MVKIRKAQIGLLK